MLTYCPHSEAEMTVAGTLLYSFPDVPVMAFCGHPCHLHPIKWTWCSVCNGDTFYSLETHALHCQIGG